MEATAPNGTDSSWIASPTREYDVDATSRSRVIHLSHPCPADPPGISGRLGRRRSSRGSGSISASARISRYRCGFGRSRMSRLHAGRRCRFLTFCRVVLSERRMVLSSARNHSSESCGRPSSPRVARVATSASRRSRCEAGIVVMNGPLFVSATSLAQLHRPPPTAGDSHPCILAPTAMGLPGLGTAASAVGGNSERFRLSVSAGSPDDRFATRSRFSGDRHRGWPPAACDGRLGRVTRACRSLPGTARCGSCGTSPGPAWRRVRRSPPW
jgi:hypothetical protein